MDGFIDPVRDPEQYKAYKDKQLPFSAFEVIQQYCHHRDIIFFAPAHEEKALGFLESIKVPVFKIGSGEVGNCAFIEKVAKIGKPVFLSTGMYSKEDLDNVVNLFKFVGNPNLVLMHCVTEYPTPIERVNLNRINELKRYGCLIGYSDHSWSRDFSDIAIVMGVSVLERHIAIFDEEDDGRRDINVSATLATLRQHVYHRNNFYKALYTDTTAWARKNLETGLRPE